MKTLLSMGGIALVVSFAFLPAAGFGEPVTVSRVWPEKIVYQPGETATITVDLNNAAAEPQRVSVSLTVRHGLLDSDELPAQEVAVETTSVAQVRFGYPIPQGRKWGHEAFAVVKNGNGETLAGGGEYFAVGQNPWEIGHYRTVFQIRGVKKNGQIEEMLRRHRKNYITTLEAYSWQPSVFDEMSPAEDEWRSGQGHYREGKEDWIALVKQAQEQGMAVVTYIQSVSYGPVGFDFARRHPDWLTYGKDGRPRKAFFDIDALSDLRERPEKVPNDTAGGISTGSFLPSNAQVGDYWIEEVIRSVEMFGWDGFRSDGNPVVTGGYDYTGKLHEVPDLGAANAEFLRKVRRELTGRFPGFLFGWNNVAGGYPQMHNSEEEEAVMLPGAYSLFEHFNAAAEPSTPYHVWTNMIGYLKRETAAVREKGGFAHVGWMGSNRYLEAVVSACGSHVDMHSGPAGYRRFEFRWSEFIWDNQLRYVDPAEAGVRVEAPERVWWKEFVHGRDLPGGRRRIVVHLVNMPEDDDKAWADRPPERARDVKVSVAVPDGKKLSRLVALSPDGGEDVVKVQTDGGATIVAPEVTIWTVVVAECE